MDSVRMEMGKCSDCIEVVNSISLKDLFAEMEIMGYLEFKHVSKFL